MQDSGAVNTICRIILCSFKNSNILKEPGQISDDVLTIFCCRELPALQSIDMKEPQLRTMLILKGDALYRERGSLRRSKP